MSHGGRGQVSARSVRRARRERKETYHAAPTTRRKIHKEERHPIASRPSLIAPSRASSPPRRPPREVFVRSSFIARSVSPRSTRAASPRACASARAFHLSLPQLCLPMRPRVRLDERGFLPRALVHPPARLVGEVVLRAQALVVVLDGGVGFGVGRRRQTPRWSARSSARTRQPTRATRPIAPGARAETACGRLAAPRDDRSGGGGVRRTRTSPRSPRARTKTRATSSRRRIVEPSADSHRSVGIDARDDLERPTLLQAERCRRQIHLCDFADVWFLADRRLDQSSPRRRWRQARR